MLHTTEHHDRIAWVLAATVLIALLFAADILFYAPTQLTPYDEFHPLSPVLTGGAGRTAYRIDLRTGEAYTFADNGAVQLYDPAEGTTRDLDLRGRQIITTPEGMLFRHAPVSPLYAFYMPRVSFRIVAPLLAGLLVLVAAFSPATASVLAGNRSATLLFLTIAAIAIRALFAGLRHGFGDMGIELLVYPGEEILSDVPGIGDITDFLRQYPERMSALSLHGNHFPPGYAVLLKGIALMAGHADDGQIRQAIGLYGWTIVVLGSSGTIPLYLLVRRMAGHEQGIIASVLFLFMPNSVLFGAVSMDALFVPLALWPLYFLLTANGGAPAANAFLSGAFLGISLLFSFSALALGLFMLLFLLVQAFRDRDVRRAVQTSVLIGAGCGSVILLVYLVLGLDLWSTFLQAYENAQAIGSSVALRFAGMPLAELRSYIIGGNLLAFAVCTGPPVVGLWLHSVFTRPAVGTRGSPVQRDIAIALLVLVLLLASLYHMETERIWLFLSPFAACSAAGALGAPEHRHRSGLTVVIALFLLAQTAAFETMFFTLW